MRLLKNHPITARNLRREAPTKLTPAQSVTSKTASVNVPPIEGLVVQAKSCEANINRRAIASGHGTGPNAIAWRLIKLPSRTIGTALAALISLTTPQALHAQDSLPVPSANAKRVKLTDLAPAVLPVPSGDAKTVKLTDLAPEVVSKIKSDHYAAQEQSIQQTYHQQLQENRQRSAFSAQQAAFEQSAIDRSRGGQFAPAAYQEPVGGQSPVAQASHNAAFPRTAVNEPDQPIAQPSSPTPSPAYSAPQNAAYSAPQTFVPPVHIPPMQPRYTAGIPARSISGNRTAVQNFAPRATSNRTVASRAYQAPVARVKRRVNPVQSSPTLAKPAPAENTHVFLQDRIANALSRHFKRGKKSKEQSAPEQLATNESIGATAESVMETVELSPPVYQPNSDPIAIEHSEIVVDEYQSAPLVGETIVGSEQFVDDQSYSEIMQANKYTSPIGGGDIVSGDRPADHKIAARSNARRRSIERAVHHDNNDEPFDISVSEEDSTIFDRYENIRQASAEHSDEQEIAPLRRPKKRHPRLAAYSRPDKYSRSTKEVPAENVSILLQEEDDDNPIIERRENFSPVEDFEIKDDNDRDFGMQDRPNLRDDLDDADGDSESDERSLRDRVRSRLDDELDLEELDREIDEELDEETDEDFEDERPNRESQKTCRQFQDELIAGSIRDISLDISPPAASEGAQYGGLARTWTDRRGNILATGALVDLRRGYVILDSGQKLAYARLSEADLAAVSEFWRLPEVCLIDNRGGSPYRSWTPQVVTWKASNLCHKPLYFENIQLERYGHSRGPIAQPIHSTLHFFTRLVALPYMTGICPPNECEYALGYYRPGNCAPWLKEPIPISLEGIRREALFVTGAAFIP